MGNRILKASICFNPRISRLRPFAEILFYRLIVNCDDYGDFYADAKAIKGRLFPLREGLSDKEIHEALDELEAVGLISFYEVGHMWYLQLCGWEEHQRLRCRKAEYPRPTEEDFISCDR